MELRFLHNTERSPFIFQQHGPAAGPAAQAAEAQEEAQRQERLREAQRTQELQTRVQRAQVSPGTKQLMRECLASDNFARQELVERFLRHEGIDSERAFLEAVNELEREEQSWSRIFNVQREIRKKIQDLQYRGESFVELIPRKRSIFDAALSEVRALNSQDAAVDRGLREALFGLTQADAQAGRRQVLSNKEASELYLSNPVSNEFNKAFAKYRSRIEASGPNGKAILRRIINLKKDEARIERQFQRVYDQFNRVIETNLSRVRRKTEKEHLLEMASKSVGITIKEGVVIKFNEPGLLAIGVTSNTVKIRRIRWEDVNVRDHKGKVINVIPGIPFIELNTGARMPLGRFKKWVDAVDAVEDVSGLSDVAKKTGLAQYGIDIEAGLNLSYPRRTRDRGGNIVCQPMYVRITEIRDGVIHFDQPVLFEPRLDVFGPDEMRESLTFGEFVKWWHRYEVEKSVGLEELQKLLVRHNEIENKKFGIEAKTNPPILVRTNEELCYPDEGGAKFRITNVGPGGVILDDGRTYTFPDFLYWVKANNVEKVPQREKEAAEVAEEMKRAHIIGDERTEKSKEGELLRHLDVEQKRRAQQAAADRAAGSFTQKLADVWYKTQFLSFKDLWNMTKEVVEFVKRKHERRSKGRYGEVGSRLPWVFGPEFERVKQAAENEEVGKYKEAMEHWSIFKVKRTLYDTNTKDIAKACIQTLIHKGEMRWDDPKFWKALNRLTAHYTLKGAELYIPEPEIMPPGKSGEDLTMHAMDALWGHGNGSEWFMENTNKFNSNKNNFEYKFKQLENDPKGTEGPIGACRQMLKDWKAGKYVNPMEYEAMIDGAIKFGKMTAEHKMFFIVAGILTREGDHHDGETLLHMDRAGELDSKYLNNFPLLDFFTQPSVYDPVLGRKRKPNKLSDYEKWAREWFPDELQRCEPGPGFARFMWEHMMMEDVVRTRMSKGIRNAENMDHDDAHLFIPPLTPTEIDNVTTGPSGQKKYFTNEGYMNAYPGFNHLVVSLSYSICEEADEDEKKNKVVALRDALNSFVRFDAILDNRLLRSEADRRARLDDRHFRRRAVVDDTCILDLHRKQMRHVVMEIAKEYGENWDWLYGEKFSIDTEGNRRQTQYEQDVNNLKEKLSNLIDQDGGEKALRVIQRATSRDESSEHGLRGIKKSRRPPSEKIERLRQKGVSGGHGYGH